MERHHIFVQLSDNFFPSAMNKKPCKSNGLITYHRICNKSNTTGVTGEAGTTYPSGAHEFTSGF